MKKKAITLVCLLSTFSLVGGLTSCSSNEEKGLKIEFWHTFGQGIVGVLNRQIDEFEKLVLKEEGVELNINLSYQGAYTDIKTKIEKGFSAANVPTIAVAYPDHVANYLAAEKHKGDYVTDLQPLMDDEKIGFGKDGYLGDTELETDIVDAFLDEGRHFTKEGTYTLPYMKSSEVMFYNKEKVAKAINLYQPDYAGSPKQFIEELSWDEFITFNEFCVENKSKIASALQVPIFYDSDANLFITKMFQNEIPFSSIGSNGVGQIDFAKEENLAPTKAMVKKLVDAHNSGVLTTKGVETKYGSDYFTSQKSLFSIGSSGGTGYNIPNSNSFTVEVCRVPYDNDNPLYVTQGPCLTMLKNPGHTKEETDLKTKYGWKLIKYLLSPEKNVEACVVGSQGYIPVRESAYTTDAFKKFLKMGESFADTAKVLLDDIDGAYLNTAVFTGSAQLRDIVGSIVTQCMIAKNDAKLDENIDKIFTKAIDDAKINIK